jgi:PAS domain S-box-containing protein
MDSIRSNSSSADRSPLASYVVAVAVVAAAALGRWLLNPVLGDTVPYITFFPAVVVAAWFGGLRPALLATLLGAFSAWVFFIRPSVSFGPQTGTDLIGLLLFLVMGFAIAGLGGAMRAAQHRATDAEQITSQIAERLRTTLASIGDAVIATDELGRVTYLNPVAESLTGWTTAEGAGLPLEQVFNIVNESTRQLVENPATKALREGVVVGLANHTVLIAKDGTELPIDDSAAPIKDEHGRVSGCVLVFRNVAEQRQAARVLRASEDRKTAMFEAALDCIISMDHTGTIIEFNSAAERTFGYSRDDVLGRELATIIIPPGLRESHRQGLARYLVTGEGPVLNQRLELSALHSNGSEFAVELTVTRIPVEGPPQFTAYLRDISDRKRAELEVAERASLAAFQADVGVVLTHEGALPKMLSRCCDVLVQHLDGAFARIWTLNANEGVLELQASAGMYTHLDGPHSRVPVGQFKIGKIAQQREPVLTNQVVGDARIHDQEWAQREGMVAFAGYPLLVENRLVGVVAMFARHELSEASLQAMGLVASGIAVAIEQKQQAMELRKLAADLSEADHRKNEFLAMLAHELRNPLAPIRNALELMRMTGGNGEPIDSASRMMERQLGQMVRLVDDLLDVSRITRGNIELKKGRIELASSINHAVEAVRPMVESMKHHLDTTLPADSIYIDADPTRLAQVIGNLLTNACKFTNSGGHISLSVERDGQGAVIRVRDDGIGIPADKLPRIFDMFMQIDTSLERTVSGLGIGLTLVKNLVELHGGTVGVKSGGINQGSEFEVRLPVPETIDAAPPKTEIEPPSVTPRRILVVDDNRDAAISLSMLLKISGHVTQVAHDGLEALDAFAAFTPDVVLLDIGLPKLNGYEVARRIRDGLHNGVVLVALTGWGQEEDRRKSREAGFDAHLIKPVEFAALKALLSDLFASDNV